jgi:hypothetical protein
MLCSFSICPGADVMILKMISPKKLGNLAFFTQITYSLLYRQKKDNNIGLQEERHFSQTIGENRRKNRRKQLAKIAEKIAANNCRKSPKIVRITLTSEFSDLN